MLAGRNDTDLSDLLSMKMTYGALMDRELLMRIVEIARTCGAWIGISTASVSKAFSLAGIRLGWIVPPEEFIRDVDNEGYHVALAHPGLQDLYGRTYVDNYLQEGLSISYAEFGDQPGRLWSVRNYVKQAPVQDCLPERLRRNWNYYGMFPNAVIQAFPEVVQFYHEFPVSPTETILTGRAYRHPAETREMRLARYLAYRIDRETSNEDQQLSIWSNESMKSFLFEGFHLSDMEYGVRRHHDVSREIMPVLTLDKEPRGENLAALNKQMLDNRG